VTDLRADLADQVVRRSRFHCRYSDKCRRPDAVCRRSDSRPTCICNTHLFHSSYVTAVTELSIALHPYTQWHRGTGKTVHRKLFSNKEIFLFWGKFSYKKHRQKGNCHPQIQKKTWLDKAHQSYVTF